MHMSKSILVVDDEVKIVEVLKSYLEKSGYAVFSAYNGKDAMQMFEEIKPSVVILDLMLPDIPGEILCASFKSRSRVPVLMLTAKADEENILYGFSIGADDYVVKPFSPRQVVARIDALVRRGIEDDENSKVLHFNQDDLIVNTDSYEVKKRSRQINLTPYEFKLLTTLARHPRKVFTREELISVALGEAFDGFDRTIDSHIKNLRLKIETDSKTPQYILTVHGIGYKFGVEN